MTIQSAPSGVITNSRAGARGAVFALTLCVSTLVAAEFMPVSLLTPMAADLHLTEGQAGQAISVSGVSAVLTALVIASASQRIDRRALLLVLGLAGLVGTHLIGRVVETHLYRLLVALPLGMGAIALGLVAFGASAPMATALLAAWGLLGTAVPVAWWTWLSKTLPDDAEAGGGLMVAVVQLAITAGATVGGLLLDASGYRATFLLSAAILGASAGVALLGAQASGVPEQRGSGGMIEAAE